MAVIIPVNLIFCDFLLLSSLLTLFFGVFFALLVPVFLVFSFFALLISNVLSYMIPLTHLTAPMSSQTKYEEEKVLRDAAIHIKFVFSFQIQ